MVLSSEDKVFKAEILQALHVAKFNYSFVSTQSDSKRFQMMFTDSLIAQSYSQSEAKVKYNLQFGIAPYCKKKLIYVVNSPSPLNLMRPQTIKLRSSMMVIYSTGPNDKTRWSTGTVGHCLLVIVIATN